MTICVTANLTAVMNAASNLCPRRCQAGKSVRACATDGANRRLELFADWSQMFMAAPNEITEGDQAFYQRAGGDPKIWYGHAYYDLKPGEAWVIEARPPECFMWNFQYDNWWMESLDHVHQKVWINSFQARYEPDGSVILVCAEKDPGWGNWIDIAGHYQGTALWRWIGASEHPVPQCRVVQL